jgi:hypothetical protein
MSFTSNIKQNHVFICENSIAQSLAICSTTSASFFEIFRKIEQGILKLYPNIPSMADGSTILDLFQMTDGKFEYLDPVTQAWTTKNISKSYAYNLINFQEAIKTGEIQENALNVVQKNMKKDIDRSKSSIQKGIVFSKPANEISWISTNDSSLIVVILYFNSYDTSSNQRTLVNRGPLMISSVPRRASGASYSFRQTSSTQSSSSSEIGTYTQTQTGGINNLQNTVAGEIELTYNNNTGRWQSGNRVALGRVVGTIDPANIEKVSFSIDGNANNQDFYTLAGSNYVSQFASGLAVIMSIENNNSYSLGPNCIQCGNAKKLETVSVINRTNNAFEDGDPVKMTNIDNEWIIEPFAGEVRPKATKLGEWSFAKMIANTDTYFKNNSFYEEGASTNSVSPASYVSETRKRFYYNQIFASDLNRPYLKILRDNYSPQNESIKQSSFLPSNRYYISSIYDQMGIQYGGWSETSIIGRTNMALSGRGEDVRFDPDCPFFWGPVYSDGYSRVEFNPDASGDGYINTESLTQNPPLISPLGETLEFNHVPAEMISKIIDFRNIVYNYDKLGSIPLSSDVFLNKYYNPTYYGTIPASVNKIQFVPMTAEFAAHNDVWAQEQYLSLTANVARKFYTTVRSFFQRMYGVETGEKNYFGNMFYRVGDANVYTPSVEVLDDDSLFFSGPCGLIYDRDKISSGAINRSTIAYDCFIKRQPTNVPLGAPRYFRDSGDYLGANCVGVISAKNTINKQGGGDVFFSVSHINIGLVSEKSPLGGGLDEFIYNSILGVINTLGGNVSRNTGIPMWGSTTDNVDTFGTTALHVRIFDSWPENQTIYDPRYFSILHFNEGELGSIDGNFDCDFEDYNLPIGTIFSPNSSNEELNNSKFKNTVRRGQLLSGGGFTYREKTFGVNPNHFQIGVPGINFSRGQIVKLSNSIEITVSEVDQNGGIISLIIRENGEGFTLGSFQQADNGVHLIAIPVPNDQGSQAILWFYSIVLKEIEKIDEGPREYTSGPLKLTYASRNQGYINKTKETSITLDKNNTGQYDCFFHFHNDITHTPMLEYAGSQIAGFAQYLDMTIT